MTESTAGRVAKGAAWMIGARMADRLIALANTVVLARVLAPADFGLMAMAFSVIALIELASAFGFELSLVRAANPPREHYDTVWTLRALFGLACGAATALAGWPAASYYGDDRLAAIMLVLGVSWAINGAANIGVVDFQRNLEFHKEFRLLISKRVVGVATSIGLAALTGSYWALVAGTVVTQALGLILSYSWHPFRPRLSLAMKGEVFSFSAWVFINSLASFGNMRAADFVLGKTHGATELGHYKLGEEIGQLPGTELVMPINRALLPGVSRMVEDGKTLREVVLAATGVVALVLVPASLGIHAVAEPLVRVVLGEKWLATIPVVQLMAINSLFLAFAANQHMSFIAAGKPHLPALLNVSRLLVYAPAVFLMVPASGPPGAAMAATISSVLMLILGIGLSQKAFALRYGEYLPAVWRPIVASCVMWAAVRWFGMEGVSGMAESLRLVAMVVAGVVVYGAALAAMFLLAGRPPGAEQLVVERLQGLVNSRAH